MSSRKRGREAEEYLANLSKRVRQDKSSNLQEGKHEVCKEGGVEASTQEKDSCAVNKVTGKEDYNKSEEDGESVQIEKEKQFQEALKSATPGDRVWELLWFLRSLPPTLPNAIRDDLVNQVKTHLMIAGDETLLYDLPACQFRSRNDHETPLLDALSTKLGFSLRIISPPVKFCNKCNSLLSSHRKPTQVRLHTRVGTKLATKYILRCRHCSFRYHPTRYGNEREGFKLFSDVGLVEASEVTFVDEGLARLYSSLYLHGWLSAVAMCEGLNWANRDSYCERTTRRFLQLNPEVGKVFCSKDKKEEEGHEDEESPCLMYQMSRKSLSQTLLNFEVKEELKETCLIEKVSFGPKEVDGKLVSFQETREKFFEEVDRRRKDDLYSHEVCHEGCKRRGCEEVSTFDGLWKVQVSLDVFKMHTGFKL